MAGVRLRHFAGAFAGGIAAGAAVLVMASWYSVQGGYGILDPYKGIGGVLGYSGNTALDVGIFVDFLIPIVVAFVMLGALAGISRTPFRVLEFRSSPRAAVQGGFVGAVVFTVFYIPVLEHLTNNAPLSSLSMALRFGLFEHVVYGAIIGLVIYLVGGPINVRVRPAPASEPAPAGSGGNAPGP